MLDLGALVHRVLEEGSEDGSMDVAEAYGGETDGEDGTCIDHPLEEQIQTSRDVVHAEPVAVVEDKGMLEFPENVVDMVGAWMDGARMEAAGHGLK